MALGEGSKSAPRAGTIAALILVLVFGSPWYTRWATGHTNPSTAVGWWLRLLSWPRWQFDSHESLRAIIVGDLRAILVVALTALFLVLLPGSQLAKFRGTLSQFFAGWASYIFAGGFAALLTTLFLQNPTWLGAYSAGGSGAAYGLFVGWIVGLATLGGRRSS
jgi:hypothetical protein